MESKDDLNFTVSQLSSAEYNYAFHRIKVKSASGLDQVNYKIISFLEEYADQLLRIFNKIFFVGVFP